MNDNLIFVQNLETDGRVSFEGLYDIDDNPVTIVIDRNGNSVFMAIYKDTDDDEDEDYDDIDSRSICEECLKEECSKHDNCEDCPISHCCESMFDNDK